MMITSEQIILIYLAFLSVAIVDLIAIAGISSLLRVRIKAVGLFWFRGLSSFKLNGIRVGLGLFPFPSSYVQFAEGHQELADHFRERDSSKRYFTELPAITKLIIVLSGVFCNIAIASMLIGFRAVQSSWTGISQLGQFLISQESGLHYLKQISLLHQSSGSLITWATLTTKVIAINLLPLPIFYGGFMIVTLFESITQTKVSSQKLVSITLLMMIVILILFISNWGSFILGLIR